MITWRKQTYWLLLIVQECLIELYNLSGKKGESLERDLLGSFLLRLTHSSFYPQRRKESKRVHGSFFSSKWCISGCKHSDVFPLRKYSWQKEAKISRYGMNVFLMHAFCVKTWSHWLSPSICHISWFSLKPVAAHLILNKKYYTYIKDYV